jgi:hypothetical protein
MKAALVTLLACAALLAACANDDADSHETSTPEGGPQAVDTREPGTSASPPIEPTAPAAGTPEHCPTADSLEAPGADASEEAVVALSDHLGSELAVSDVIAGPATESAYFEVVAAVCGAEVLELSWFVRVCSVPCAEETSASLPIDYFLARSAGQWQVYFEY